MYVGVRTHLPRRASVTQSHNKNCVEHENENNETRQIRIIIILCVCKKQLFLFVSELANGLNRNLSMIEFLGLVVAMSAAKCD